MKAIVVGGGAVGTILAAHLVSCGHDITVLARGRRAAHLREYGVRLQGLVETTAAVSIVEDPQKLPPADFLFLAVKTYDTAAALRAVSHMKVVSALSLQNGVLKDEQLAQVFGEATTLGCTADFM